MNRILFAVFLLALAIPIVGCDEKDHKDVRKIKVSENDIQWFEDNAKLQQHQTEMMGQGAHTPPK